MGYSRSRARCLPLQYETTASRGVKQALNNKQLQSQNLTLVSTPLQEKGNNTNLSTPSLESINQQSENGMFYELSNKKRMECEKYQDCSWFQENQMKSNCKTKLSLAENFDPFLDTDDFYLPMQYATPTSLWGNEYLELFSNDTLLKENKLGDKNENNIFNENFYSNCKDNEYNAFDSCYTNFKLKKTDSVDSMKNILLTNPAEVIPISEKERLNNVTFDLGRLGEVKSEVKNELDLSDSNSYVVDSDESDLIIGREEEVDEVNSAEDLPSVCVKETVDLNHTEQEMNQVQSDYALKEQSIQPKNEKAMESNSLLAKGKNEIKNGQVVKEKMDFNLNIPKISFEQPLTLGTPDLDFMDLVDFINEEMQEENENSTSSKNISQTPETNHKISSAEKQNGGNVKPIVTPSSLPVESKSTEYNVSPSTANNDTTVNLSEITNTGVSIAERIKTVAKRKTRKSIKEFIDDDESSESFEEDEDDDDDDEDYDCKEDITKRRGLQLKRKISSSFSESHVGGKKIKEETSSYRERRDKNNEASRRSRQNRKAKERHMYETLEEEEKRNVKLKAEADVLEKQVTSLRQLLLQVVLRKGGAT